MEWHLMTTRLSKVFKHKQNPQNMVSTETKTLVDYLKKVSPGSALRIVIDDLISSDMGALIVFYTPELEKIIEGGFKINSRFTPNRLFELCKMDGAVIVSQDLKKILYCNVLLAPDIKVPTSETGTRHKAAERTAKQVNTFVIAVSERRNKTTLYLNDSKHFLKTTSSLLSEVNSNLQLLESQREHFDELVEELNMLEVSGIVTVLDVCKTIQKTEMMMRVSEMIKRYFTELGNLGTIMNLKYKELLRGVEKTYDNILRDYSLLPLKKSKALVANFNFDTLMELEIIAKLLLGKSIEEVTHPKGYRFLTYLQLDEEEISAVTKKFKSLEGFFEAPPEQLKEILKRKDIDTLKNEANYLKEQMLAKKSI